MLSALDTFQDRARSAVTLQELPDYTAAARANNFSVHKLVIFDAYFETNPVGPSVVRLHIISFLGLIIQRRFSTPIPATQ